MADQAKIWDRFAKKYAERKISNEDAFQKKVTQTQAYLTPESQIFEFGCGTGTIACLHSPCAKHILATDISAKMLEIAKQRADAKDLTNITFQQGEILDFSHQLNRACPISCVSDHHVNSNLEVPEDGYQERTAR